MRRKWLKVLLGPILGLVVGACGLWGCSSDASYAFFAGSGKLKVLSTTAMIDDLVGIVGGEEVDHMSLIVGDIDPHSYELVKGDDEKLLLADIIFYNGLGLEHGASLRRHLELHKQAMALGDLLYREDPTPFIVMDGTIDPHFWMDIALFSRVVDLIVKGLSECDGAHAWLFHERGEGLKKHMIAKDLQLVEALRAVPSEKRYLVTSHDAFYYFARKYLAGPGEADSGEEGWRDRFMAPEGLAPDGQLSLADLREVTEFLFAHQIHVVFPETNLNQDGLRKIVAICRERGLDVRVASTPLYGDTMGGRGTGADSYLEMIEHNVHTLCAQLPKE